MPVLDADQPLVLSSYCLGTTVSFAERVRVAAGAGFSGIGLRAENYWDAQRAGLDDSSMLEILGTHGVQLREVEYVTDWCGTLTRIEGTAENVVVTVDIGRQVSLYAFNDWTLAFAGSVLDLFSTRTREPPPPGLSDPAIAALKTLRLGERIALSGRMGQIAGAGVFDWSRLFGKSEAEHRQFLQTPRFVARIEALAAEKKK